LETVMEDTARRDERPRRAAGKGAYSFRGTGAKVRQPLEAKGVSL
jgi:hypothetical protein